MSTSTVFRDLAMAGFQASDEEVVARVLSGDTALYEVLMRRYNQRLFRIARTILRDDDEAEDVMQDTYVRAYAALHQFAGRSLFSTWLVKIAIYEASSRLRKQRRLQHFPVNPQWEGQSMESVKSSEPDPEQQTLNSEAVSLLERAVEALPELYRCVFILREIENMSTAETAACLELTEETVKVRLLRARQILRNDLYARAGATSSYAFRFMGDRCDRVVSNVFSKLHASQASITTYLA
ncbi:MAG TPA: RNA polymerase sigma factor [Bryobacteraceae bacterium]|nr:RNA polymerase sigma factor [Bryobacteraceae bacterium]